MATRRINEVEADAAGALSRPEQKAWLALSVVMAAATGLMLLTVAAVSCVLLALPALATWS